MFERFREVGHPPVSLLLMVSLSVNDNALCDVHNLSVKYKIEGLYESMFTIINTFVEIAIQHPSWEGMILHERLYNEEDLHLNLSYSNCTELVLLDGMLHCAKPLPEPLTSFFSTGLLQTFSELWEISLFKHMYFVLSTKIGHWNIEYIDSLNTRHTLHKARPIW